MTGPRRDAVDAIRPYDDQAANPGRRIRIVDDGISVDLLDEATLPERVGSLDARRVRIHGEILLTNGEFEWLFARMVEIRASRAGKDPADPAAKFSMRRRQVLMLIVQGRTMPEIADELGLSIKTIDTHRHRILVQAGCRNNADLVRFAYKHGYLVP